MSATNVSQFAQPKKHHEQQCVCNNVSSFASTLSVCDSGGLSQIKTAADQTHFSVGVFIGGEHNVLLRVLQD